jgi:hypothetical protein
VRLCRPLHLLIGLLLLGAASCTSGDSDDSVAEPAAADETASTPSDTNAAADTPSETGADAPSGPPLVEGLPIIEVFGPPEVGAGLAPQFRWEPIAAATRYSLALRAPDGPQWAWQGEETEIYIGGLPFERPPGWAGPVIVAGTCWAVMARGADGHVIAASEYLSVSPGDSPGQPCVPGEGEEPGT